ncbi:conjugal transfer protein TraN [Noviherbaspirillum sp. CPCC 100848]|uniref:Conjugal transfer protein TraN n=1 Tax=Noviherbaspirillum album TaxID=3080276 RepID=A0ABU6J3J9_9BURK|nr:conjugal transfer protein TraN [Noviherbaspirillum sp. CPCC 100848]MEC4718211.1 conjugal transfer protein TraN [Noviherbaspirillum sp. CPCC 100848]
MKRLLAYLLAVLQVWMPLVFEWQGAVAAAQTAAAFVDPVVKQANEGQQLGAGILQQQVGSFRNTAVVDQHVDPQSASDFGKTGGKINLQDFGLGGNITEAQQVLQNAYSKPDQLNDITRQSRRDMQERGCPNTSFQYARSAQVLTITPIKVTLTALSNGTVQKSEAVDTTYTGVVRVKYPTIGHARTFDQVISNAVVGTPGVVLRYDATPYTVPNDGSHFTFNHQIHGAAGAPVVVDFGNRANGYATESLVYAQPGSVIKVTADLYRVKRTYTPQPPSGCPADPPSCVVSGINFCGPPALGVLDVFQASKSHKNAAMGTLLAAASAVEYDETNADVAAIVNRGSQVLNGTDSVFTELFTGCSQSVNFTTNTVKVREQKIQTCSMPLVEMPHTCNGSRNVGFVYLQTSTVLTASFFQKVQVALIDPMTGQPAKDAQGNIIYTTQDKPAVYSGAVDINVQTFGGARAWESTPDSNGYYIKYDLTPFSVAANEYFPYAVTALSDGAVSSTVSSLGSKMDNWKIVGTASVSGASQLRLNAQLYQVMNNQIAGCDTYLATAADGFCTAQMQCTDYRGPCTTLNGVEFCEGSGAAAGIADLLKPWGVTDSAQAGGKTGNGVIGGGAKEFLPKLCWAATGNKMNCESGYKGNLNCYTDANGNKQCGSATGEGLATNFNEGPMYKDDCASPEKNLFGNPQCRLVSTNTCTDGAAGLFSGTCYNKTVVYDCGTEKEVTVPGGVSYAQSCGSPVRCMGTECHNPKGEVNHDFGRAVASANVVDMAARDLVCAETGAKPTNTSDICTPIVFNGTNLTCKIPVGNQIGITPDCCKESDKAAAEAPNAIKYAQLVMYSYKLASDKMMMQALSKVPGLNGFSQTVYSGAGTIQNAIDGGIAATKNFMMDSASTVAKTFGYDVTNATTTNVAKEFSLDSVTVNGGLSQAQMSSYYNFLSENGLTEFADTLITQVGEGEAASYALTEAGESAMQALEAMQTAFMVYSIAKIIGHIVFKCEKTELELGTQKKQGNCHYVGSYCAAKAFGTGCIETRESYCCYKTPLARMVAEQIRQKSPEIAGDYGDAKNPRCGGFTPAQIAAFDWNKFDPSEWLALLQDAGLVPNSTNKADTMWGLNSSRAALATGSPMPTGEINIQQQTINRYQPMVETYTQRRNDLARQPVCFGNAKEMAWYQPTVRQEDVVRAIGGNGVVQSCGEGCIDVYMGKVGDNYIFDHCSIGHDQYFDIAVDKPEYIQAAYLMEAQWDDHLQVTIGGDVAYQSPQFANPPPVCELNYGSCFGEKTAGGKCDRAPSNDPGGPIDVSHIFKRGGTITTNTRVWTGGAGEGFARVRVLWSQPQAGQAGCIYPSGQEAQ